ncbi:hypothetical protein QL285_036213 [Trifolium repens]|nr:hypothetical protein QL285_036213 [Trifolium repens]
MCPFFQTLSYSLRIRSKLQSLHCSSIRKERSFVYPPKLRHIGRRVTKHLRKSFHSHAVVASEYSTATCSPITRLCCTVGVQYKPPGRRCCPLNIHPLMNCSVSDLLITHFILMEKCATL